MKKLVLFTSLLIVYQAGFAQDNVGIGIPTPHPSAILHLESAGKGLLVPRTDTATINSMVTPASGLIIYQTTDSSFYYFDGLTWRPLGKTTQGPQGPQGIPGPPGPPGNDASIPSGVILMWSGSIVNIPAGYALCDGTNGTPNLLDRFIVSVPDAATNPGATGGAHTYSLSAAQLPPHDHTGSGTTSSDGAHTHTLPGYHLTGGGGPVPFYNWDNPGNYATNTNTTSQEGTHSHSFSFTTSQTGSGADIDNRPKYYSLAFIMKL